ncbi:MAG: hypothetical protein AAF705_02250, partial [Bacteroidota bacterium]
KLHQYYNHEGRNDPLILKIPKGSYEIKFVKRTSNKLSDQLKAFLISKSIIPFLVGSLITLLLAFAIKPFLQEKPLIPVNGLWSDLSKSEQSCVVVLGDLFIYTENDTIQYLGRTIRDPFINSLDQFEKFQENDTRTHTVTQPLNYSLMILGNVVWIKKLSEIFFSLDKSFTISTVSRFNPKELQNHDFIVIGMMKTLGIFNAHFHNSNFNFEGDSVLTYTNEIDGTINRFKPTGDPDTYHKDYGYMAKYPGPNNNTIYYFGGIWDTGASQSLKNFTDPTLITQMEDALKDKYGLIPPYYEVLFEVDGIDRMEVNSRILILNQRD